jgi:hypothetical protein
MVDAKAWTAFDLRTECEPMKAIFARRLQGITSSVPGRGTRPVGVS